VLSSDVATGMIPNSPGTGRELGKAGRLPSQGTAGGARRAFHPGTSGVCNSKFVLPEAATAAGICQAMAFVWK